MKKLLLITTLLTLSFSVIGRVDQDGEEGTINLGNGSRDLNIIPSEDINESGIEVTSGFACFQTGPEIIKRSNCRTEVDRGRENNIEIGKRLIKLGTSEDELTIDILSRMRSEIYSNADLQIYDDLRDSIYVLQMKTIVEPSLEVNLEKNLRKIAIEFGTKLVELPERYYAIATEAVFNPIKCFYGGKDKFFNTEQYVESYSVTVANDLSEEEAMNKCLAAVKK